MSKDQAAMLRALVQGQTGVTEKKSNETKTEEVKTTSSFSPFGVLTKPSQILRPKVEVQISTETVIESVKEEEKGRQMAAIIPACQNVLLKTETPKMEVVVEEAQAVETPEVEAVVELTEEVTIQTMEDMEQEVNLQEVSPLAQADEGVRILAVCSGKGGVGKTNVVLNLAIALRRQGKKPLIIDTDFGFTNIDVLCGVVAPYSLQNVLTGEKELKDIVVEGPEGVRIIPGGNDVIQLNDMSSAHKKVFQEQFAQLENVDVLLIDMGAGVSKTSLLYTMFAQEILLVVTPEPTSLTDAYSLLKTMELSHIEHRIRVVVNRATNLEEAQRTFKKLEATVSNFLERITLEYVTCIQDDPIVSASVKAQIPFLIKHPDSAPAKDVTKLMELLFSIQQPKKRFKDMKQVVGRLMRVFG